MANTDFNQIMYAPAVGPGSKTGLSPPVWLCFCLMLAAWYAVVGAKAGLSQWMINADDDAAMAEALAWHDGRLDIPHPRRDALKDRMHDTAYVAATGKVYSISPPLLAMVCFAAGAIDRLLIGEATRVIGPVIFATVVIAPLLLMAFRAFYASTGSAAWGAFLGFGLLAATADYPLTVWSQGGNAGYVSQLLAQTGVLLIVSDLLGRRRMWPAAAGLVIGAWSRQLTLFYALPMLASAWTGSRRRRDTAIAFGGLGIALGVLMTLSYLKFGSPFDTGYRLIYEGRTDDLALRARQGLFALRWVPDNLWYMLAQLPYASVSQQGLAVWGHTYGDSLVFTTPLVVLVFASARQWWADVRRRWLMLATVPVIGGILTYHAPGFYSAGCYRFGMDFVPVWLTVAGPAIVSKRWRWWALGLTAWSLVYFQMVEFR